LRPAPRARRTDRVNAPPASRLASRPADSTLTPRTRDRSSGRCRQLEQRHDGLLRLQLHERSRNGVTHVAAASWPVAGLDRGNVSAGTILARWRGYWASRCAAVAARSKSTPFRSARSPFTMVASSSARVTLLPRATAVHTTTPNTRGIRPRIMTRRPCKGRFPLASAPDRGRAPAIGAYAFAALEFPETTPSCDCFRGRTTRSQSIDIPHPTAHRPSSIRPKYIIRWYVAVIGPQSD
jgi:hypothetical protein